MDVYDSLVHVDEIAEAPGHRRRGLDMKLACSPVVDNSCLALERALGQVVGHALHRALAVLLACTSADRPVAVALDRCFEDVDMLYALEQTHALVTILE